MKKRLLVSTLVTVVLAIWLRLQFAPPEARQTRSGKAVTASESTQAAQVPVAAGAPTPANKQEFLRDLMQRSNRPIRFYGKVIDQDNNPVPEVKVRLSIRTAKESISGLIGDVFEEQTLTTDAQGRFELTDAKGALLTLKSLEKPGYEASIKTINRSYWYWRETSQIFTPDFDTPEVFRVWKNAGAEKLILQERMTRIPYDGSSVTFDLLSGRQAATGGDLRVTLIRSPEQIQWGQRNFDWTLTLEAVDGGVAISNDEQMFRAPAEGYLPKAIFHMPSNAPDWTDEKAMALYVRFRGGKFYGRIEFDVMVGSDKPTTGFSFRSAVNPSGSRNLEYDPLQDVLPVMRPQPPENTPSR